VEGGGGGGAGTPAHDAWPEKLAALPARGGGSCGGSRRRRI